VQTRELIVWRWLVSKKPVHRSFYTCACVNREIPEASKSSQRVYNTGDASVGAAMQLVVASLSMRTTSLLREPKPCLIVDDDTVENALYGQRQKAAES
jgi:hypothetical protein